MINRKLVRPNLAEIKERMAHQPHAPGGGASTTVHREQSSGSGNGAPARRRPAPAELTNAEAFYYLKQMNSRTPMVVILDNGEQLRGHIEWYDRGCLKIHRTEGPNLLVFKHSIRYLYKQEEENQSASAPSES